MQWHSIYQPENRIPDCDVIRRTTALTVLFLVIIFALYGCANGSTLAEGQAAPVAQPASQMATFTTVPSATTAPTIDLAATRAAEPTSTFAPTATTAPTQPPQKLNACLPENAKVQAAQVVKVVDGDTIDVTIDGAPFTVRYIGMDTPETKDPNALVEFYGPEAASRNAELVADKAVTLVQDTSETDRYGRLLRYVFADGLFVNETLVKEGFAQAKTYPPDTACGAVFASAQEAAKAQSAGLWSAAGGRAETIPTLAPTQAAELPTLAPTLAPAATSDGCPQGCLEQKPGCDIKGNISSGGKIYHDHSSNSYEKTKIEPEKGERWFCTAEEAVANGWRAPKN